MKFVFSSIFGRLLETFGLKTLKVQIVKLIGVKTKHDGIVMSILEYNIGKVNNKQVMVTMNKSMNAKLQKMIMSKSMR